MTADLRLGRWQDVLSDVTCDALISDPPYGPRTHSGNADRLADMGRSRLIYPHWTHENVREFVLHWSARTRGWIACMTSDDLVSAYRAAYSECGRQDFAPVPILQHRPRLSGDGPGSCAVYLCVARPRAKSFMSWGSLPGWYESVPAKDGVPGGKPIDLMRALVRDYTRPGDLVCDPCAGGGTTLLAALMEGRRAVGAECMPEHYDIARKRLEKGFTPPLFQADAPAKLDQPDLFGTEE